LGEGQGVDVLPLADFFCRSARLRIEKYFRGISKNTDHAGYKLAQETLDGKLSDVERGIVS